MEKQTNITITVPNETDPMIVDLPLTDVLLPDEWELYLYDKQLFKKLASKEDFKAQPHRALCTIRTVNDVIYLLQLMKLKGPLVTAQKSTNPHYKTQNRPKQTANPNVEKLNLDMNDYIIMRKGIEPIWEDPRNKNGGTFTIITEHKKGYDIWATFIMYILGETLTTDMNNINGISVSYISDSTNQNVSANKNGSTYIKIWDGKQGRSNFIDTLPEEIISKIKNDSTRYANNNTKSDYNESNIFAKLGANSSRGGFNSGRGGFRSQGRGDGGGGEGRGKHRGNVRY